MPLVEKVTIDFDDNEVDSGDQLSASLVNFLSETKSLSRDKKASYYFEDDDYEDDDRKKKKKKDKKKGKKGKKKKGGSLMEDLDIDIIANGEYVRDKYDEMIDDIVDDDLDGQIDADDVFNEDDEDEEDDIISEQRRSYKKNKGDKNNFKKEFAEEFTLLYGLLNETKAFGGDLDKLYKAMSGKRFSKYTTDIILSINSNKQTKLQILKEISSLKKTIADLSLKDAKNAGKDESAGVDVLAASYLQNIINHGRQDFVNAALDRASTMDSVRSTTSSYDGLIDDYDDGEELNDQLMEGLDQDEEDGKTYRSAEADAFIKYENMDVKIKVMRDVASGDWEFVAINKYDERVFDYPLPDKSKCSPVKFTADGSYCQDVMGRSYKVIETF